ncbi:MAG TPA: hypothetical protein VGB77_22215 [Abditibacteriaceae bacterium]|jgi:hypothetical protein
MEAPELYSYVRDFLLLLTVPNSFDFAAQSQKWRRAIRVMSECWQVGSYLNLKHAADNALAKLIELIVARMA